jgi:electron-transferring-flavoprotein dehydrogenase
MPYGGWYFMLRNHMDGGLIVGDWASLLNSQRVKRIHTAIKSGVLVTEAIYESLCAGDASAKALAAYQKKIDESWLNKELLPVRHIHQAFRDGLWKGLFLSGLQFVTGGRGLTDPMRTKPGYEDYKNLQRGADSCRSSRALRRGRQAHLRSPLGLLSFLHAP